MSKINENSDFLDSWRKSNREYAGDSEQDTTAEAIRSYIESEKDKNTVPTKNNRTKDLENELQRLNSAQEYLDNYKQQLYEKIRAIDEQITTIEDKKLAIKSKLTGKSVEKIKLEELLQEGRI